MTFRFNDRLYSMMTGELFSSRPSVSIRPAWVLPVGYSEARNRIPRKFSRPGVQPAGGNDATGILEVALLRRPWSALNFGWGPLVLTMLVRSAATHPIGPGCDGRRAASTGDASPLNNEWRHRSKFRMLHFKEASCRLTLDNQGAKTAIQHTTPTSSSVIGSRGGGGGTGCKPKDLTASTTCCAASLREMDPSVVCDLISAKV